jgi:outer membrane protein OmpA-like peptidoglycan-associated protein
MNVRVLSMRAATLLIVLFLALGGVIAVASPASAATSQSVAFYTTNGYVTTTTSGSATYSPSGTYPTYAQGSGSGTITFASTSTGVCTVNSSTGLITFVTAGTCTVTADAAATTSYSDSGPTTFTLTINPRPPTVGGTIQQASSTSGATTTEASASYVIGPIVVDNAVGTVTYVTTTLSGGLSVSQNGAITTSGTLVAGIYTVSGTDSDPSGASGTWTYSLTVSNVTTYAVTFSANGGTGTMATETENTPTALTLNAFKRSGYTFTKWSTAVNGSGSIYADGSTYPFTSSTTLYAQWTVVKVVKVVKKGKGIKKPAAHVVRFNAHGGTGTMATERDTVPTVLTANRFTRSGYSFVQWNTAANGSGSNFANGALYPFTSSTTLYAQWKAKKVVAAKPAVDAVVTLGKFAAKSSILSTALQTQVSNLAREIKANRDTNIALVGYGDTLLAANQLNESAWAANFSLSEHRATAVEAFLEQQLKALGVAGYTISVTGNGTANPGTSSATSAEQAKDQHVIATLT